MAPAKNLTMVMNAGSSSLKFKVFQALGNGELESLASGLCERIGDTANSRMKAKTAEGGSVTLQEGFSDHQDALGLVSRFLADTFSSSFTRSVHSVGHRVVHGLDISAPVLIDDGVKAVIEKAISLAPLHNPAGLQGIEAAMATFPAAPHVAVFDTAFHQTMAPAAYMYALPKELYDEQAVRRYGFHGSSYKYLVPRAAKTLGKPVESLNAIICHLGAGSSMCAVRGGQSVDTTMGLTPLEGLVMGTRCGDIDPAIVTYLLGQGHSGAEVDALLNKRSGFLGLTGHSDLRAVIDGAAAGSAPDRIALDVWRHRIRKYIGAYALQMGGPLDALIFSAGIGENSSILRAFLLEGLEWYGIALDEESNKAAVDGVAGNITAPGAKVQVLVIPTDEELSIAEQAIEVVDRT
ncbi:Acetate kinase [Auxenochlorella protothecoides]|uniref:Probable acetate kinase n=1 Tax=Auxenochlorella protothecoides TaxID=3075 RepID=A0A087SL08_AUXPR|nr:Acetate kinase [Auxenochlorella protothecoides]KFM26412.1 Acetate kinase [Auxenochlorella protothecoides]